MKHVSPEPKFVPGNHRQQMMTTVSFNNKTGLTVTTIGREGMPCRISPTMDVMRHGVFYIYLKYEFDTNVSFNSISQSYPENSKDRKLIEDAIKTSGKTAGKKLEVVYEIGVDDLQEYGTVYFDLLDLLVSIEEVDRIPPHPKSQGNVVAEISQAVIRNMFSYHLVIVDNGGFFGKRYIRIGTEVYPIPTLQNHGCPDGIYIVVNHTGNRVETSHYMLHDPECPITLYTSMEEARNNGGIDAEIERRLKREQNELKQRELEAQASILDAKGSYDLAKMELEEQLRIEKATSERERQRYDDLLKARDSEMERLRKEQDAYTKNHFETEKHKRDIQSTDRKTAIEWLKIVPPVISVATALMTLWVKK